MNVHVEPAAGAPLSNEPATALPGPTRLTWPAHLAMVILSAVLLTLSFAPLGQFYLAWIGLAPLLVVASRTATVRGAFFWGWLGGTIFFLLNLAYLLLVTIPGALLLPPYLAVYWGLACATIRAMRLIPQGGSLPPETYSILACCVAAVWVAAEWLRGTVFTGLPWLFIGYTQSPLLAICQIADFAGVYGVMFLVVLVNTMVAVTWLHREQHKPLRRGWMTTGVLVLASVLYGWWRLSQTTPLTPGPTLLVVQPNDRDFRNKAAPEKQRDSVRFHLEQTTAALQRERADLVVWSETTMPALNPEVREELGNAPLGQLSEQTDRAIAAVARLNNTSLLVGGFFVEYAPGDRGKRQPVGMRNSAFYYDQAGLHAARYDKIHLVPFGEFIPGRESWPRLYRLFLWLSPYSEDYTVSTGPADALTVFPLQSRDTGSESRFVSPICFDDIDPALVARMFRGKGGEPPKRADFIVNLTNDGWFRWNEQPQHLQHALFRSIENRAPTARAVNTGVSGFIDSCGRVGKTVPIGEVGTATQQLTLDRRVTFYTRFGDVFAYACLVVAAIVFLCGTWSLIVMRAKHG